MRHNVTEPLEVFIVKSPRSPKSFVEGDNTIGVGKSRACARETRPGVKYRSAIRESGCGSARIDCRVFGFFSARLDCYLSRARRGFPVALPTLKGECDRIGGRMRPVCLRTCRQKHQDEQGEHGG